MKTIIFKLMQCWRYFRIIRIKIKFCKLVAVRGLGSVSRRTFGHRDSTFESTTRDHLQLAE
jgi:hypothetical protein